MGHHIDDQGRFQSDKFPDLPPDKVIINLTDPKTRTGLLMLAEAFKKDEATKEFGEDLEQRVRQLHDVKS